MIQHHCGEGVQVCQALYNVWQALAHWFKSNDELVGNAVEDECRDVFPATTGS